jgi:hypothetical protein
MIENKKIMPILVIVIAMSFHSVDIFTEFEVSENHLIAIDVFLAPFGLGGLVRAGHKTYVTGKIPSKTLSEEDRKKLESIVGKIQG